MYLQKEAFSTVKLTTCDGIVLVLQRSLPGDAAGSSTAAQITSTHQIITVPSCNLSFRSAEDETPEDGFWFFCCVFILDHLF